MASATTMATDALAGLSLADKVEVLPNLPVSSSSASYWTTLLRASLSAAQAINDDTAAGSHSAGECLIDEEMLSAPRRRSARSALAQEVASQLYQGQKDALGAIIQYERDIVMLRGLVMVQRRRAIEEATRKNERFNWIRRISRQGPWNETKDSVSTAGAPSLPMPVEQSDKESLVPFFEHLRGNGTHDPVTTRVNRHSEENAAIEKPDKDSVAPSFTLCGDCAHEPATMLVNEHRGESAAIERPDTDSLAPSCALCGNDTHDSSTAQVKARSEGHTGVEPYYHTELIEFEKGVLYADGRVDLCKMVTGPRNIGDLMDSLKPNTFSKHFLLGNNIIGPVGAKAIAAFIDELPDRFETWYLAGNCIDATSFRILVDDMTKSTAITNVWLKRNPLGSSAAADVFRLITKTPNLRTLDLDQTELSDAGVAELFSRLANHGEHVALRNVYLNGCGVGYEACTQIGRYLASSHCGLEALYMSSNPIGQAVTALAGGLASNRSLQRLSLQSCGLKDEGVISLAKALKNHTTMRVLDLGQAYATEDLGMRYNWITDDSAAALTDLVRSPTLQLQYLNLSYLPMSLSALNGIVEAIATSASLLWFHAKPLFNGGTNADSVHTGQDYTRLNKRMRERLHENVERVYGVDYERFESEHKRFLISPQDVRFIDSVSLSPFSSDP